jgi:hypothetical protein
MARFFTGDLSFRVVVHVAGKGWSASSRLVRACPTTRGGYWMHHRRECSKGARLSKSRRRVTGPAGLVETAKRMPDERCVATLQPPRLLRQARSLLRRRCWCVRRTTDRLPNDVRARHRRVGQWHSVERPRSTTRDAFDRSGTRAPHRDDDRLHGGLMGTHAIEIAYVSEAGRAERPDIVSLVAGARRPGAAAPARSTPGIRGVGPRLTSARSPSTKRATTSLVPCGGAGCPFDSRPRSARAPSRGRGGLAGVRGLRLLGSVGRRAVRV